MTKTTQERPGNTTRRLACARCGAPFTCNLHGPCWCGEEAARLPLPKPGEASATGFDDCLCRDCLRAVAAEHAAHNTGTALTITEVNMIEIVLESFGATP